MARRYEAPDAFKQALEARLKLRAQETGEDIGRLRQRSVFQRFLARAAAHFGDRVVVKGGIALQLRIASARTTRDVDLRMSGDPSRLQEELRRAGQLALDGDFLTFTVELDPRHPTIEGEGVVYEGQRFRVEATVSARSGHVFSLLFQSNSLREIPARLRAAAWMAMAEDERASGVSMA
jgi:hypothetical protein